MSVYILTNDSFPDYVKIESSSNIDNLLYSLNNNLSCPTPYKVFACYKTDSVFTNFHNLIDLISPNLETVNKKINNKNIRIFYKMSAIEAAHMLQSIAILSGTENNFEYCLKYENDSEINPAQSMPSNKENKTNKKTNSPRMNMQWCFEQKLIQPGDIVYIKNHKDELATVIDENTVEYMDEKMSFCKFGCKVTGWPKIQIYVHLFVNDDDEVLAEKVKKKIKELNNK